MDFLAAMRVFVRVVETGSFSAVARETNTTQPTISRLVAQLEDHLGARLFQRTTRQVNTTEEGRQFYDYARRALEAVTEAESAVGRRHAEPEGMVRLAAPVVFSRLHLLPRLPRLLVRHPKLGLDLVMHDGFADLVGEGIDLALRVGEIDDPSLVVRRVGVTRRVIAAAPSYLEQRGEPQQPRELTGHDCIVYTRLASGNVWHFDGPQGPSAIPVQGRFQVNNSEGVREAVLMGLGIGVVPIWLFRDEIEQGHVRLLLADYEPLPLPMHIVYPSRRFVSPRVRAVIDFLNDELRMDPLLSARSSEP
ncbi:MAG: LysR family transcriptional regulator [Ferrovibrio sp.]|jgi:DNA-binding transcriptional LysR family regulator|uniref:LysR family transcriptional regulator n=1 Tax=Ferrovibrio sp. TaxID=1917215 RepID=UPI00391A58A7